MGSTSRISWPAARSACATTASDHLHLVATHETKYETDDSKGQLHLRLSAAFASGIWANTPASTVAKLPTAVSPESTLCGLGVGFQVNGISHRGVRNACKCPTHTKRCHGVTVEAAFAVSLRPTLRSSVEYEHYLCFGVRPSMERT